MILMKNSWFTLLIGLALIIGCKDKKNEKQEEAISAISIIKGQVHRLDSSMYSFIKLERNGNRFDTTYLKRDEIRKLAEPFLSLPDITEKKIYKKYTEEKLIDAQQETLNITSLLKE